MDLSFSKEQTLPEKYIPGRVYFTGGGIYIAISETELEQYSITNIQDLIDRVTILESLQINKTLTLRSYLFGVSGTYDKTGLETLLHTTLEELVNSMRNGSPIVLFSTDSVSANISFVIESNYTLDSSGVLTSCTLMWHQYQLWNTLSITRNDDNTYTLTNTTE